MAPRYYFRDSGGSTIELTSYIDRKNPPTLKENAEEGSVAISQVTIADPDMSLDLDGLRRFWIVEDDSEATDDVIFGGFSAGQEISRGSGDNLEPLGRVWQLEVADANSLWNRRVMTGSDCKRPAETDVARVQWLFTTAEAGIFDDVTTYVYGTPTHNMDANDYRRQYRDQVINDAAQESGKNWWVQYQYGTAYQWNVWYGRDSETGYSSDLYLSNDPSDWTTSELEDGTSLVWPVSMDTQLKRDPQRVYSGVLVEYEKGAVYRHSAATQAAFCRRDYVASYPNVKTKTKAIARATRLLAKLDTQDDRITTTVRLPKGKATKIRAGMRVPFKATHFSDYDDQFYWMRVLNCAVTPHESGDFYDLALELAPTGQAAGSGLYAGDVFAGIIRSESYSGDLGYAYEQDSPPAGWDGQSVVGPIAVDQSSAPFTSMTVSADMVVRCSLVAHFSQVAEGDQSITVNITVNGSPIGTDVAYYSAGLGFWTDVLEVDVRDVSLAAGDVVGCSYSATAGAGWTNFTANGTYLRVGRGSFVWDNGSFVGP